MTDVKADRNVGDDTDGQEGAAVLRTSVQDITAIVSGIVEDLKDARDVNDKHIEKMEVQAQVLADAILDLDAPAAGVGQAAQAAMAVAADPNAPPRWNECPECHSLLTEPLHRSPDGHGYKYFTCSACQHIWTPSYS